MTTTQLSATWVDGDEPQYGRCITWLGGNSSNPTWDEYLAPFCDEIQGVLIAVRECCERDGLDLYGDDMGNGYFALSNGRHFSCSWLAWGDFRQAMVGKREGYMRYYMRHA